MKKISFIAVITMLFGIASISSAFATEVWRINEGPYLHWVGTWVKSQPGKCKHCGTYQAKMTERTTGKANQYTVSVFKRSGSAYSAERTSSTDGMTCHYNFTIVNKVINGKGSCQGFPLVVQLQGNVLSTKK
ncbi:MAG: hypothetical protein AAGG80_01725 [Pseudomonadota bacterium]